VKKEEPMKIRPVGERILVKRIEEEEKSTGGIVIPDTAKEKPQKGKVIALGTGKKNEKGEIIPFEVEEGSQILFGKYAGSDIEIDGEEYLFVSEDDILAVL
jgi:chaperonin GroES